MKVQIDVLYPYENSGVATKIANRKKEIQKGRHKPIKILKIGDDLLVIEGNNRVAAAKELGLPEIDAVELMKSEQEIRPYIDALECAKTYGWKGFANWPVDAGFTERAKRYGQEKLTDKDRKTE